MRIIIATLIFSFEMNFQKDSDTWGIDQKVFVVPERKVSSCFNIRVRLLTSHLLILSIAAVGQF
jgi:hypothetical protein